MKRLFKLTTVALGLVVLGSCSNDDLFNSSNGIAGENGKGTLAVNVETPSNEMGIVTRAVSDENMSATIFEKSDKIRVYDNELHRWDGYQFDGSKFSLFTEADLTAPEFAIYPFGKNEKASDGSDIIGTMPDGPGTGIGGFKNGSWSKGGITTVEMTIPSFIKYKEVEQTNGTTAYWCSLPMWGKVTSTEGKLETDLKYMTAILRVSLKNAKDNVDRLEISAYKDEARTKQINLSGDFKATLNTSDFTKTQLGETLGGAKLTVDVSGIAGSDAYVFVPIVPCTNAIVVIKYFKGATQVPGKDGKNEKVLSQKNYVRGTLYKAKGAEFEVTTGTVKGINSALVAAKAQTEPVEITANVKTTVTDADNEIIIPEGMTADITLDLQGIEGTRLYINDKNVENPYKGNITVITEDPSTETEIVTQLKGANVQFVGKYGDLKSYVKGLAIGDAETTSTATLATIGKTVENVVIAKNATVEDITANVNPEINVNVTVAGKAGNILATGDVVVDGGFVGNIGSYTSATENCLAKSVKVTGAGDGTPNAVNIFTNGAVLVTDATIGSIGKTTAMAGDVTITSSADGKKASVDQINTVGSLNVTGKDAKVTNIIRLYAGKDATSIVANITDATINGSIKTYGTDKTKATPATITVTNTKVNSVDAPASKVTFNTADATTFAAAVTADRLNVKGKASVTGAITANTLVINGEGKVKTATVSGNVQVKLSKEGEAVSESLIIPEGNVEGQTISLLSGYVKNINMHAATKDVKLKFGAAQVAIASVTEGASAKLVPAAASVWDGKKISNTGFDAYKSATTIYTATQLASMSGAESEITLANNIDLGTNQAWTMPALTQNFTGKNLGTTDAPKYPEIKGLHLKAESGTGAQASKIGLFTTISAGKSVSNITINGVTSALTAKADASGAPSSIGAVAGVALGAVTIENVEVKALNITSKAKSQNIGGLIGYAVGAATINKSKVTAEIQGQYNLGGLIGLAGSNATLKETKVANTKFTVIDNAAPVLGSENNSKAGSVGMYFGKINGNVDVDDKSDWGTSAIANNRAALGYHQKFNVEGNKVYYYYGGYDGVGYWGNAGVQKLKDAKLSIAETTVEAASNNDNVVSTKYNQYVLQSKWK